MKIRGFFALLWAGLLAAVAAFAGQPVAELYDKAEYRIAMRDSVALYTAVYTPKAPGEAPVIIFRTPYGCGPYGAGRFPQGFEKGYLRSYVDRGYIIVMQDVRGRYMSEGDFEHVRPAGSGETDETTDSYDTVDWLVRHIPHNNGRVGFAGCSYPGFYAMMGGLCGHPAVKAPVTDWFMGDDVHHNGVLMLTDSYRFLSGMNTPPGRVPAAKMPSMSRQTQPDERTFFLEHTALAELTGLLKPNPFWEEMSAHPDYDAWWQERDLRRACYNVQPAVLVVGGTFDAEDCFGAWTLYRALNRQSPSTPCHLPREARKLTLYLADGGILDTRRPTAKTSASTYVSDPSDPVPYCEVSGLRRPKEYMVADQRFLFGRPDVLTFVSEPLEEDMTLVGPVDADLEVTLSTTDADFVVKLIDLFPEDDPLPGYRMLVRGDIMRGRYRRSFSRPEAFTPGVPARVPFRITDIAHTFRAGHRIMVQVQSTWFPLAERNPQQFVDVWNCRASDFVPCRISLLHQRDNASSVTVWRLEAR